MFLDDCGICYNMVLNSKIFEKCRVEYKTGADSVCQKLYDTLVGIQTGRIEDTKKWIVQVDWAMGITFSTGNSIWRFSFFDFSTFDDFYIIGNMGY